MLEEVALLPKKHISAEEVASIVRANFGTAIIEEELKDEFVVKIDRKDIVSFATFLKESEELKFDYLRCLLGVDRGENLEVIYLPYSLETGAKITVRVPLSKEDPVIPSLYNIWKGSNWQEREGAEMYGITFEGHPDPRKLLLPDDFNEHPLRKEFKLEIEEEPEKAEGEVETKTSEQTRDEKARGDTETKLEADLKTTAESPKDLIEEEVDKEGVELSPGPDDTTVWLNMGPQHPSTHGVFRMQLQLDAERIVDCIPHLGYLHRGWEKLAENRTYLQVVPLTDRLHYINSIQDEMVYCMAVEKLLGIEVPKRAQYIRVILFELQRISNHLIWYSVFGMDMGAITPYFYGFREREMILDMFEMVTGARLTTNFLRFGGIKEDIPNGFVEAVMDFIEIFPAKIQDYEQLLTGNEIVGLRTKGVGILKKEDAIDLAVSGPVLRASGVKFDLRKAEPYSSYDEFDFDIPVGKNGGCFDRYKVRIEEMRQSLRIAKQALEKLPDGEVRGEVPRTIKPEGEVYTRVESSLGELGCYLVADGSTMPSRVKIRAPSFVNLQALPIMLKDVLIPDVIITFSTIDICMGEVDR
jgi:NADH:ubiquinone oxidoreductase subunit D/NADH:ubiquinone oxidoreductase subunit C